MVAGCSEGMHGRQLCSSDEGGGSRAARVVGREFCPLASTQGAAAGAVARVRRAAIGRFVDSVMAAWLSARAETKLGIKKLPNLATVTH